MFGHTQPSQALGGPAGAAQCIQQQLSAACPTLPRHFGPKSNCGLRMARMGLQDYHAAKSHRLAKLQLGIEHVLPRDKIHRPVELLVRGEEIHEFAVEVPAVEHAGQGLEARAQGVDVVGGVTLDAGAAVFGGAGAGVVGQDPLIRRWRSWGGRVGSRGGTGSPVRSRPASGRSSTSPARTPRPRSRGCPPAPPPGRRQ